uniref:Medium-chain acyl-CoA ligase ACSF2, mitochondrial n=1 Tax=Panagrolaimus superbus TaxID=310955 RepID=A0A914Z375_9BILA
MNNVWEKLLHRNPERPLSIKIKPRDRRCVSEPTDMSYVYGASNVPLLHHTIGERFRMAVTHCSGREVVIFKNEEIRKTYKELYDDSRQLAASLLHLGLEKGDRVGIWGPNYYEWIVTQFATAMAGLVLVNINPAYQSNELRFALHKVEVKALITPPKHKSSNYYRTLCEIIPEMTAAPIGIGKIKSKDLPELKHIILFKPEENKPYKGVWHYSEVIEAAGSLDFKQLDEIEKRIKFDDPVNVQYTSGTTGNPKAATLSHHNLVNNSYFIGHRMGLHKTREIMCLPPPLYHTFGCGMGVLCAINHHQTCIFPSPSFNAEATVKALIEEKATMLYGTPTMFIDILNRPELKEANLIELHGGIIAGAPCPTVLCERLIRELGMSDFVVCYGSTEISPVIAMSYTSDPPEERTKSVGHVMDHCEMAIVDSEGCLVKRGDKGELLARGYSVMRGYFHDEEKTRDSITADRWYHTGDTAYMNENGSVVISGRSKDMIIRGGENIYPTEIEFFLMKHRCVADAQVIGVPDERYGEEICVWIRLKPDCKLTEKELKEYCKGKISHNKIPKYILFKKESEFPLTATGKVMKYELRNISRKELGLDQVQSHFNA